MINIYNCLKCHWNICQRPKLVAKPIIQKCGEQIPCNPYMYIYPGFWLGLFIWNYYLFALRWRTKKWWSGCGYTRCSVYSMIVSLTMMTEHGCLSSSRNLSRMNSKRILTTYLNILRRIQKLKRLICDPWCLVSSEKHDLPLFHLATT